MKSRNQSKMTLCWISNNNYRHVEITIFVGGILERKKKQQKKKHFVVFFSISITLVTRLFKLVYKQIRV